MPARFLFLIDVSVAASASRDAAINAIISVIEHRAVPGLPRTEIGIVAFDDSLHMVRIRNPLAITIPKSDIFVPLPKEEFVVYLEDEQDDIIAALNMLRSF